MKKIRSKSNFLVWSGLIVALVLIYGLLNIPGKEGFNPSDDGVVLAQSYRILQGEIPHAGFISIRPVGSAILHLLNFLSPFPLEWSSRWFVLIEYFLYSLFLTLSLKNISGLRSSFKEHPFLLPFLTLAVFVLNQNHYNLFPWTTIDALLWISIASYGFTLKPDHRLRGVLVVLGSVLAACSRQTFLLPGVVLSIIWFAGICKRRAWYQLLPALVIGLIPVGVYLGVLIR
ncbi:MAG: hypothetical protein J7L89_02415, partial [Bacteroidales bacterium]|nr:hypothetical protein [Bacteroidales bacterium]